MNAAKQSPRTASEIPRPSKSERILVVDDEETIREIIASMLKGAHFQTRQAANGIEALALLESGEEFDLVLSDLMMPEMDGTALLERAKERYPDIPIIIEVPDLQVALQALRDGAYDYLMKPFERQQLMSAVHRALEDRRLKLANREYEKKLGTLTIPAAHELERILVQHQEESIREITSSLLTSAGYECRGATSPAEAWDILSSGEAVGLLLCKVVESLENKLIERVVERFPDIPVVVWGARPIPTFMLALRMGAYDYLSLPFERDQLLVIVRRALECRRLRLENREYKAKLEKLASEEIHG